MKLLKTHFDKYVDEMEWKPEQRTLKRYFRQGLNVQSIQTVHRTQQQKNKQPNQKMVT